MKSILDASKAMDELAKRLPSEEHEIMVYGSAMDVPLPEIPASDDVLVKPGGKIPLVEVKKVGAIIFNKTGTLTEGKVCVTDMIPYSDDLAELDREKLLVGASNARFLKIEN